MVSFKYMGQLGNCNTGYRGFAFSYAVIRNAQGQLTKIPCLAIFSDFDLKEETKAFCKERGGTWAPHPQKFWYVPLRSSPNRSWDCVREAIAIAVEYVEKVDDLYMFASGFGGAIAEQVEEACISYGKEDSLPASEAHPDPTAAVLGSNNGKGGDDRVSIRRSIKSEFPALNQAKQDEIFGFLKSHVFEDEVDLNFHLKRSFSPEAREKVARLQSRYNAVREREIAAESKAEETIQSHLRSQMWWLEDEYCDPPEAYLEISADWVRVEGSSNDGHCGLGDRLPKGHGRRHLGGKSWQFNLSALPLLRQLGFSEVYHPGVEK